MLYVYIFFMSISIIRIQAKKGMAIYQEKDSEQYIL